MQLCRGLDQAKLTALCLVLFLGGACASTREYEPLPASLAAALSEEEAPTPSTSPPQAPMNPRREMTADEIDALQRAIIDFGALDRESLDSFLSPARLDVQVTPVGPMNASTWAYSVAILDSSVASPSAILFAGSAHGPVEKRTIQPTRSVRHAKFEFRLAAANAPFSALKLELGRSHFALLLRSFPATAPE